jgi:hypothetical protein
MESDQKVHVPIWYWRHYFYTLQQNWNWIIVTESYRRENTADHLTCMRLPVVGIQLSWCPVAACCDNTVRKLFSIYMYEPRCIFLVKMFRSP